MLIVIIINDEAGCCMGQVVVELFRQTNRQTDSDRQSRVANHYSNQCVFFLFPLKTIFLLQLMTFEVNLKAGNFEIVFK